MAETVTLAPPNVDPRSRIQVELKEVQAELASYYTVMKRWSDGDLGDAFQKLSAFSARASELRGVLNNINGRDAQAFRTRQIEPFLEECDRQFKVLSRIQSIRQFDWDQSKGGV